MEQKFWKQFGSNETQWHKISNQWQYQNTSSQHILPEDDNQDRRNNEQHNWQQANNKEKCYSSQVTQRRIGGEAYRPENPLEFPKAALAWGGEKFVPAISIFIGFPSSWTLLYLLTATTASAGRMKTTSAVP